MGRNHSLNHGCNIGKWSVINGVGREHIQGHVLYVLLQCQLHYLMQQQRCRGQSQSSLQLPSLYVCVRVVFVHVNLIIFLLRFFFSRQWSSAVGDETIPGTNGAVSKKARKLQQFGSQQNYWASSASWSHLAATWSRYKGCSVVDTILSDDKSGRSSPVTTGQSCLPEM